MTGRQVAFLTRAALRDPPPALLERRLSVAAAPGTRHKDGVVGQRLPGEQSVAGPDLAGLWITSLAIEDRNEGVLRKRLPNAEELGAPRLTRGLQLPVRTVGGRRSALARVVPDVAAPVLLGQGPDLYLRHPDRRDSDAGSGVRTSTPTQQEVGGARIGEMNPLSAAEAASTAIPPFVMGTAPSVRADNPARAEGPRAIEEEVMDTSIPEPIWPVPAAISVATAGGRDIDSGPSVTVDSAIHPTAPLGECHAPVEAAGTKRDSTIAAPAETREAGVSAHSCLDSIAPVYLAEPVTLDAKAVVTSPVLPDTRPEMEGEAPHALSMRTIVLTDLNMVDRPDLGALDALHAPVRWTPASVREEGAALISPSDLGNIPSMHADAPSARKGRASWSPIQRRARKAIAHLVSLNRPASRPARAGMWVLEATWAVAFLGAGMWASSTLWPPTAHPEVASPPVVAASTSAPQSTVPSITVPDWADSIPDPDAVWGLSKGGRTYRPVGAVTASRASEPQWDAVGGDSLVERASPVLVRRLAGANLLLYALTGDSITARGSRWALAGVCQEQLTLQGTSGAWSSGAREVGAPAGWLYALAVPAERCVDASAAVIARAQPTTAEREGLLRALLGVSPTETGAEVQDVAFGRLKGERHAWGVFRLPVPERITMVPAPPSRYASFVAKVVNKEWTIEWLSVVDGVGAQMALAGVFDADGDGVPEAVFGRRERTESAEVLVVGRDEGTWAIRLVRDLGGIAP